MGGGSGSGTSVTSSPLIPQNPSHQSAAASAAPKILLAKPGLVAAGKFSRGAVGPGGGSEDDSAAALRSRLPSIGSLNLLSDSWDFNTDRFLPVNKPAEIIIFFLNIIFILKKLLVVTSK